MDELKKLSEMYGEKAKQHRKKANFYFWISMFLSFLLGVQITLTYISIFN